IQSGKLDEAAISSLKAAGVSVAPYEEAFTAIRNVATENILLDPKRTCFAIFDAVPDAVTIVEDINPSTQLKAVKNKTELAHTRNAMRKDGVALTKFFKWLEENVASGSLSEMSIADKLQGFR